MPADLVVVSRVEQATCDLTDKEAECVVCRLSDGSECVVAVTQFVGFLRMEQRKRDRANANPPSGKKSSAGQTIPATPQ